MRNWLYRVMAGRYGSDNLNRFLSIAALVPLVASFFFAKTYPLVSYILWGIALVLLVITYFRMFSRNIYKRQAANQKYLSIKSRFTGIFTGAKDRASMQKDYKFFKCPSCRAMLRVPRGKGRIRVTCRKCGTTFVGKS